LLDCLIDWCRIQLQTHTQKKERKKERRRRKKKSAMHTL